MSGENKHILHPRLHFKFFYEMDEEVSEKPFQEYTMHYTPGNMQKHLKAARSVIRRYVRKYDVPVLVDIFTELYEIEESNNLPHSYRINQRLRTEYLGQISCDPYDNYRFWFWSYWHNGDMSSTTWREEVNNA